MTLRFLGLHDHVIVVDCYGSANQVFDHFGYQPMVSCSCVFQPERHYSVALQPFGSDKRSILFIWGVHCYLMVPPVCIQEAHPSLP